ncbi:L-threonylcarbamoyladenylate synthase [Pontibacillus litoralis]|uniref:Threonylcarbamoyl-AMP synthase n=1 Tax=Pontibacillus litoralis JSM 072002 TaxID=1385512 RepID=A0A0A5G051_9BACI|nr:L-threonylcarbamoyladenylate synthase [Pontibacillus litoralis]KGX86456.1 tRNA threonylcarbamoyladenosine biosynthesis protein [Pontibacillus litoralis JSM 072002]
MGTYETKLWQVTKQHIDREEENVQAAAALLKKREVVAFPTETVYGLGADATNEQAVKRIFEAKGRPSDNPLIVHVAKKEQIEQLVTHISDQAHALIDAFTPGPLTVIMPSNGVCARNVTAGLDSVGVRVPDHPVAKALLEASDLPLAAPSANRSGKPSPTTAAHVYDDLNGRVAGILDGGATGVGVESTVVDCTGEVPVILRPGGVTKEALEAVVGTVKLDASLHDKKEPPRAPGMKYTHYAPDAPLWLIDGDVVFFQAQIDRLREEGRRVGVIASEETSAHLRANRVQTCGSQHDLHQVAVHLYDALRSFDQDEIDIILAETFASEGIGVAIMNRLSKAASKTVQPSE